MDARALVDAAPALVITAGDDRSRFANAAAKELYGTQAEDARIDALLRWVDPGPSHGWRRALALNASRGPTPVEVLSFTYRDSGIPTTAYLARVPDPASSVDRLVRKAAHDLNEPLRMVSAYATLLQQRYSDHLDPDGRQFLAFAADGAQRMEGVVEGLVVLARLRSEPPHFDRCDAGACAADALASLSREVEARGADVRLDGMPVLLADPRRMTRLFRELLSNALKFSERAPRVVASCTTEDADAWRFTIADNGIGIDARFRERVFEPFERLHPVAAYPGAGVGLAICREIVQSHGGRIDVDGTHEGSKFVFTIPRFTTLEASG